MFIKISSKIKIKMIFLYLPLVISILLAHVRALSLSPSQMYSRLLLINNNDNFYNGSFPITNLSNFIAPDNFLSSIRRNFFQSSIYQSDCVRDFETILVSAAIPSKRFWALKYLDAWAKPPSGIMRGNFAWYGDFDECLAIEPFKMTNGTVTIRPQYCRIGLTPFDEAKNSNKTQVPALTQMSRAMIVGICVSTACNADTLALIVSDLLSYENSSLHVDYTSTSCYNPNSPLTKFTYIAIGILSTLGILMILGFVLEVFTRFRNWVRLGGYNKIPPIVASSNSLADFNVTNASFSSSITSSDEDDRCPSVKISRIFLPFSPYSNAIKLFTLPPRSESIPNLAGLHGVRALSILWVILGHCCLFMVASFDNLFEIVDLPKKFSFQIFMSALFGVDSFFFLSGFFAYLSLWRHFDVAKRQTPKHWFWRSLPLIYVHRYLRIAPPYLAIVMIDLCLWPTLSGGPLYFQGLDVVCLKNWWANLFFVSNFLETASQCVPWGWYLAIDMQLFIVLAPFLVALFIWRPKFGWIASFSAILCQAIIATSITYAFNLSSSLFQPQTFNNQTLLTSDTTTFFELFYIKPYCRFGPYVVGIIVGHIVVRHSFDVTLRLFSRPGLVACFWLVSMSTIFFLIFGQFGTNSGLYVNPKFIDALYNSFARTAWGIALGWLTLALVVNRAGPLGRILNWQGWALPAKLSYTAYLVHPLIFIFFVQTARRPFHATLWTMTIFYFGIVTATFLVSTIFSLTFESPIIALQKLASI